MARSMDVRKRLCFIATLLIALLDDSCVASGFQPGSWKLINFSGVQNDAIRSRKQNIVRPANLKDHSSKTIGDDILNAYEGFVGTVNTSLTNTKQTTEQKITNTTTQITNALETASNQVKITATSTATTISNIPKNVNQRVQTTKESIGNTVAAIQAAPQKTKESIESTVQTVAEFPSKVQKGVTDSLAPVTQTVSLFGKGLAFTGNGIATAASFGKELIYQIAEGENQSTNDKKEKKEKKPKTKVVDLQARKESFSLGRAFTGVKDGIYDAIDATPEVINGGSQALKDLKETTRRGALAQRNALVATKDAIYDGVDGIAMVAANVAKFPVEVAKGQKNLMKTFNQPFIFFASGFFVAKNTLYDITDVFSQEERETREEKSKREAAEKAATLEDAIEEANERKRLKGLQRLEAQKTANARVQPLTQAKDAVYAAIDTTKGTLEAIPQKVESLTSAAAGAKRSIEETATGAKRSIEKTATAITLAPERIQSSIDDTVKIIDVTATAVQSFPSKVQEDITNKVNQTAVIFSNAAGSVQSFGEAVVSAPEAVAGSIQSFGKSVVSVGEAVASAPGAVADSIQSFGQSVASVGEAVVSAPGAVAGSIQSFGQSVASIPDKVTNTAQGLMNPPPKLEKPEQKIINPFEPVTSSIKKTGSAITNTRKSVTNRIEATRSSITEIQRFPETVARTIFYPFYVLKMRSDTVNAAIRTQNLEDRLARAEKNIEALPAVEKVVKEYTNRLEEMDNKAVATIQRLEKNLDRLEKMSQDMPIKK